MDEFWRINATKLGEQLASEHFESLPIDPFLTAKNLDIVVEPLPADRKSVSGTLLFANNVFGIQYATYIDSPGFQNFCVSHELAHYSIPGHPGKLLSNGYHESIAGFTSNDRCEQEADHFAAGFLMPSYLIDPVVKALPSGLKTIESLARQCRTSLPAAAIRYTQKTEDAVAIVVSEGASICYCFMSDAMKEIRGINWVRKNSPLPQRSVTRRFNNLKNNVLSAAVAEGEASLLDWFGVNAAIDLYEEVKGLGHYGKTLTVLTIDDLPDQEEMDDEDDLVESWTPRFKR